MDPRHSVRRGNPLAIAAEQVNWLNRQMRGNSGFGGSAVDFFGAPYIAVYAKNDTQSDVPRWGVMEITGLEVVPTENDQDHETQQFCSMPILTCGEIDESAEKWCVALEPIGDGKIGRVAIAGAVQVKKDDLDKLFGAFVLWEDDNWALVLCGGSGGLKLCKTVGEWDYGTTASLEVWHGGTPPSEESSGETVDAINKSRRVAAGSFVIVGKAGNGSWYLVEAASVNDQEDCYLADAITTDGLDDSIASTPLETGDGPQVLIHNEGCAQWAGLKKITVLTSVVLTESGLVFGQDEIWTFPDLNSSLDPTVIETTDCPPPE